MLRNGEQVLLTVVLPVLALVGLTLGPPCPTWAPGPGRRRGAGSARAGRPVDGVHRAGDRDRLRPPLRGAPAARHHAARPRRPARREGRGGARHGGDADRVLGALGIALGWRPHAGGFGPAVLLVLAGTAAFVALALLMAGTLRSGRARGRQPGLGGARGRRRRRGAGGGRHDLGADRAGPAVGGPRVRAFGRPCRTDGSTSPPSACFSPGRSPDAGRRPLVPLGLRTRRSAAASAGAPRCGKGGDSQPIPWLSPGVPMRSLRVLAVAGVLAAAVGTGVALASPSSAAGTSQVSVLHAVPGATGRRLRQRQGAAHQLQARHAHRPRWLCPRAPTTSRSPRRAPAPTAPPAIEAKGVKVPGRREHHRRRPPDRRRQADPDAVRQRHVRRSRPARPGITVRHDAAAPAVDVRAGGTPRLQGPDQPERGQGRHPRRHRLGRRRPRRHHHRRRSARPTLNLEEGTNTIVYAWGSAERQEPQARRADHQRHARQPRRRPRGHRRPRRRQPAAAARRVHAPGRGRRRRRRPQARRRPALSNRTSSTSGSRAPRTGATGPGSPA